MVGGVDLGLNLVDDVSRDLTSASSDEALDVLALDLVGGGDDEFRDLYVGFLKAVRLFWPPCL